ncbi:4-aminobutyrate aminotransferase-like enzyme [Paraburkholderia sp. GAS206C]|uniref:aspartate aminotransferase family protein n=1 Tax=unclassified Paraburkholderia TaxID=2615204 RepID=UPI003D2067B5
MDNEINVYSRNTQPSQVKLVSGKGAQVFDSNGKRLIDCCSQTLNSNLGQCHPEIISAVETQVNKLTYASSRFSSDVSEQLHKRLVQITPEPLTTVNLANVTGSLANEGAVKMARKKTNRSLVISRERSHLGQSFETMRISGKHENTKFLGKRNVEFFPAPYCFRCPLGLKSETCDAECLTPLENIQKICGDDVAAVIVEPIMVDAGVLIPKKNYHKRLQSFCKSNSIPLIWDEIQTAFGWLCTTFAMDLYDVVPDILTLGKGLGAGFPIAATVFRAEFDVLEYGDHEFTAGAHPVSCAASLAMLNVLKKPGFFEKISVVAQYIESRLRALKNISSVIGDVRGHGFLFGVEFVTKEGNYPNTEITKKIFEELMRNGVVTRVSRVGAHSNVIQFKPPIIMTMDQAEEALTIFEKVVRQASIA